MKYKKLTNTAITPTRDNPTDAGLDFYADGHALIKANGGRGKIPTGIAIEIESGMGGFIWPRSKLADTYGIDILAGVIDAPYRGELMISVINHGYEDFEVLPKDKIAQLIRHPVALDDLEEVSELSETERGDKGINSSDLRIR